MTSNEHTQTQGTELQTLSVVAVEDGSALVSMVDNTSNGICFCMLSPPRSWKQHQLSKLNQKQKRNA